MKRVGFVGAAAVVLVLQGCGGYACDSSAHPGLIVRVQNASGGAVCDASVTATDGHYSEVLQAGGTAQDCMYVGALERRGDDITRAALDAGLSQVASRLRHDGVAAQAK
jgi:hypothetical protein